MGAATLELEEREELELLVLGGSEEVEGGGVLVLLGRVLTLVGEGVGLGVVVVLGSDSSPPKDQVPRMTPCASVPPKKWKRPGLKSKSPGPQLTHWIRCQRRR